MDALTDDQRPLTDLGMQQSSDMGKLLAKQNIDLVLVSPYLRAQQTWDCMAPYFDPPLEAHTVPDLKPSAVVDETALVIEHYAKVNQAQHVLVVSHMPLISALVCEFAPMFSPLSFVTASVAELNNWEVGKATELYFFAP